MTHGSRSRAAVVLAARELFTHRGFHRTTIRAIAASAAVSPSLVIKLFRSKSSLYTVCGAADVPVDGLDVPLSQVGSTLVRRITQRHIDGVDEPWTAASTAIRGAEDPETEHVRVRQTWLSWLAKIIDDPTPDRDHAAALACLLIGYAEGLRTFGLAESDAELEKLADRFSSVVQGEIDRIDRAFAR